MFLNQDKQGPPVYKVLVTGTFISGLGHEFSITIQSCCFLACFLYSILNIVIFIKRQ